jgi:hypothetical protein
MMGGSPVLPSRPTPTRASELISESSLLPVTLDRQAFASYFGAILMPPSMRMVSAFM